MLFLLLGVAFLLSLLSLRGERARARFYRQAAEARYGGDACPRASVIVPVKGWDEGLRENLASYTALDYPDYELIIAARSAEDVPEGVVPATARLVLSGAGDSGSGEKIQNLLAAVHAARTESEVFVFADSDGRPGRMWLRALVNALAGPGTGAATGYRWHLPEPVDTWSLLRSVWNAVIAGGMGAGSNTFCWGGATAIRRTVFESLRIAEWWRGAVSDDYRLSEAVRAARLRIVFAPRAMVASTDHTGGLELLMWTRRQLMITRFYAPKLWWIALVAHVLYCGAMVAGVWLAIEGSGVALTVLALMLGIGMWKGANRVRNARVVMPEYDAWFRQYGWLHTLLVPVGTWLWLWSCMSAAVSSTVEWRGRRHRLRRLPRIDNG